MRASLFAFDAQRWTVFFPYHRQWHPSESDGRENRFNDNLCARGCLAAGEFEFGFVEGVEFEVEVFQNRTRMHGIHAARIYEMLEWSPRVQTLFVAVAVGLAFHRLNLVVCPFQRAGRNWVFFKRTINNKSRDFTHNDVGDHSLFQDENQSKIPLRYPSNVFAIVCKTRMPEARARRHQSCKTIAALLRLSCSQICRKSSLRYFPFSLASHGKKVSLPQSGRRQSKISQR